MEAITIKIMKSELTTGTVEWVKNYLTGSALKVVTLNDGSPGVQLILNSGEQDEEKKLLAFIDSDDLSDSYVGYGGNVWGAHPTSFSNNHLGGVFSDYLTPYAIKLVKILVEHAVELLFTEIEKEEVEYTFNYY